MTAIITTSRGDYPIGYIIQVQLSSFNSGDKSFLDTSRGPFLWLDHAGISHYNWLVKSDIIEFGFAKHVDEGKIALFKLTWSR